MARCTVVKLNQPKKSLVGAVRFGDTAFRRGGLYKRRGLAVKNKNNSNVLIQSTGEDPVSDAKKIAASLLMMMNYEDRVQFMEMYRKPQKD